MKTTLFALMAIMLLMAVNPLTGGQFIGGNGYLHTNSALCLNPGALDMSLYLRGYVTPFSDLGYTLYNGTGALSAAFGFSRHLDLVFSQELYQNLNATRRNEDISAMIPGGMSINFKFANYSFKERFYFGIMPSMRYRAARYYDIQFEPYRSYAIEGELILIGSYFEKPLYPDECLSAHINLGYVNHNDRTLKRYNAQEITYLVSFLTPRSRFDYGAELYGSFFMMRPTKNILSREDWMYITPFMRYNLFKGLRFILGMDLLLLGRKNTSTPRYIKNIEDYPNYPTWRLTGRIKFTPSTAFYSSPTFSKIDEKGVGRPKRSYDQTSGDALELFDSQAVFRWAVEEKNGDVKAIKLDLEEIRNERKKAEQELKRLKKALEEKRSTK